MALDGMLLHTICNQLKPLENSKLNKIASIGPEEIVFYLHTQGHRTEALLINTHSNTNRIYISKEKLKPLPNPSSFVMVLRKNLSGAILRKVEQAGFDRILVLEFEVRDELLDQKKLTLYAELMGKYANLLLVDEDETIIDAAKRIPVFENSKRLIHPGAKYALPPKPDKVSPLTADFASLDMDSSLVKQVEGFSPLLSKEYIYRAKNGEDFASINKELFESDSLYLYEKDYHGLELKHLNEPFQKEELMAALGSLNEAGQAKERLYRTFKDVYKTIEKEKKKSEKKLPKLNESLKESQDYEKYQKWGDLLFAYQNELKKEPVVKVEDFETQDLVDIPIDMRYDLKQNANLYYKKYHKQKRAGEMLKEQIEQCENDIEYFSELADQLEFVNYDDLEEIRTELVKNRYLMEKKAPSRKKKGKPHVLHIHIEDEGQDYDIFAGKNNLQNTYITHQLSARDDLWFHVKDYHGSHVLVKGANPTEKIIRLASMLASYYSKARYSSSVPVNYTKIHQLKKIPKAKNGMVSMKSYNTIYIDPDLEYLEALIKKNSR